MILSGVKLRKFRNGYGYKNHVCVIWIQSKKTIAYQSKIHRKQTLRKKMFAGRTLSLKTVRQKSIATKTRTSSLEDHR